MKLKDLKDKRVVLNYQTKGNFTNDQQGIVTHVGQNVVAFNIGRKEIFIDKNRINYATEQSGEVLYKK